jgi:hypothetical protein
VDQEVVIALAARMSVKSDLILDDFDHELARIRAELDAEPESEGRAELEGSQQRVLAARRALTEPRSPFKAPIESEIPGQANCYCHP